MVSTITVWPLENASVPWITYQEGRKQSPHSPCSLPFTGGLNKLLLIFHTSSTIYFDMGIYHVDMIIPLVTNQRRSLCWMRSMRLLTTPTLVRWPGTSAMNQMCISSALSSR